MSFQSASLAGISIERLQTLCAVVEAGSIALAAGPDPNRQSQFSRQLKELEKALGLPLFDRVNKILQPNEQGRRAALAARTFFAALDDLMNTALRKANTIKLGAGESILRWLVMPHLAELMSGDPPLRFEVQNYPTKAALREVQTGGVDIAIVRSDSVTDELQSEVVNTLRYVLAVPRVLLRSREAAEVFEGRPLPFADLSGDGLFTKTVQKTAAELGLNLQPVVQGQTFSLLISAVESGTAAAFLPDIAAKSLPEERFARVATKGMRALDRDLSLVWKPEVAESRSSIRIAIGRLRRVLATSAPKQRA